MSDYFGYARFSKPAVLVSDLPGDVRGYVRRTVDGQIVYVFQENTDDYEHQPYIAEWEFFHQPYRVVKNLRWLWRSGRAYWFGLDSVTGYGSLSLEDGVTNITHYSGMKVARADVKNYTTDKWNGKIKVLVSYAYEPY